MHDQHRIDELAHKWLNGTASKEEEQELFRWWRESPESAVELPEGFASSEHELKERILQNMQHAIRREHSQSNRTISPGKWIRYAAAAIVLIVAGAMYYLSNNHSSVTMFAKTEQPADIGPGTNKAILTLADGRKIEIDGAADGTIAQQQGMDIIKQDAQIKYAGKIKNTGTEISYNTMTTPRGGTYQLILPDGTKAWLNAASSIRYPVVFAGGKREVEVEGEVYFEVAKDKKKPFIVDARDQHIRVLGTRFNVNSYDDESQVVTTLLEGSVNVNNKLLSPGQSFSNGKVRNADTEKAIAWTKGITYFNRTGITAMMREVSRWYDIDVEYKGVDTKRTFTGQVPRTAKLSTILKLLSAIDIHYNLDPANKKIVLHP